MRALIAQAKAAAGPAEASKMLSEEVTKWKRPIVEANVKVE